ncbi:hypothetical protein BLSTO_06053 [Blastocystis sp. subtype 1]
MAYTITNRATELIKELKRSDWVPKYNVLTSDWTDGQEEGINAVLDEMDDTMEKIVDIYVGMEEVTGEMPESEEGQVDEEKEQIISGYNTILNIHHCAFYHDKRCLLAYLKHRLGKIRDYRWEKGNLLSDDAQSLLSKGEIQFFQKYDDLLSSYMQRSGFDLTSVFLSCTAHF